MRKRKMAAVMLFCMLGMLTGCGKKNITIENLKDVEVENYVTLPDYKNLDVPKPEKVEVTDAYVKSYINTRVDAVSELHELTGTVENGDVLNIDYAGTIDGTAFEGGTAQGQLLEIGSGGFIAGFEEGLIGVSVGETKELDLQFPEDYTPELAGKDCVFAVTVNYILTELTDENVNLVDGDYDSVQAYLDDAKDMLIQYTDARYERELESYIATSLVAACTYEEIPQSLVDDYKTDLKKDFESDAEAAGMSLEEFLANIYQVPVENVDEELDAIALRCAREGIALQAIANAEGLSVSDEELDEMIADYTAAGNTEEDLDKETVRINLLYDRVYNFLVDIYKE